MSTEHESVCTKHQMVRTGQFDRSLNTAGADSALARTSTVQLKALTASPSDLCAGVENTTSSKRSKDWAKSCNIHWVPYFQILLVHISPISLNDVNHRGAYTGQAYKEKFMPRSLTHHSEGKTHHSEGKTIRLQTQSGEI